MIVYFANRNEEIIGTASLILPKGNIYQSDKLTHDLETGASTFECKVGYNAGNRLNLEDMATAGNYILVSGEQDKMFTIIKTEYDTEEHTVYVYGEDAGLELLNTVVPAYTGETQSAREYFDYYLDNTSWQLGEDESSGKQAITWDGETTLTERLISIATNFKCNISYRYVFDGLTTINKYIDIHVKHNEMDSFRQLRLNYDVKKITTTRTIENLATAFECVGNSSSITLKDCDYSSDGETTHTPADPDDDYQIVGKQLRCVSAMEKWKSKTEPDGLIVKQFSYSTKDKKVLFGQAVAELRQVVDAEVEYAVEFNTDPGNIGDYVYIIDDAGELYLEARILTKEVSQDEATYAATLGEYKLHSSGISDSLLELSRTLGSVADDEADTIDALQSATSDINVAMLSIDNISDQLVSYQESVVISGEGVSVVAAEMGKFEITSDELSFYAGDSKSAFITPERMDVPTAYMTEIYPRVKIGDEYVGDLCWEQRHNGHYSLKIRNGGI